MSKQPEARIVTRDTKDGKIEISVVDPHTLRECRTGLTQPPEQADKTARQIAEQMKRAGNKVSDVHIRRGS